MDTKTEDSMKEHNNTTNSDIHFSGDSTFLEVYIINHLIPEACFFVLLDYIVYKKQSNYHRQSINNCLY